MKSFSMIDDCSRGQMICIGHEDGKINKGKYSISIEIILFLGNVIIGSVEGSRIAGKCLRNSKLAKVEVNNLRLKIHH